MSEILFTRTTRLQEKACGPGGTKVDAVRSGNLEGGEIVSPLGSIASKVVGNLVWQRPMRVIVAPSRFFLRK